MQIRLLRIFLVGAMTQAVIPHLLLVNSNWYNLEVPEPHAAECRSSSTNPASEGTTPYSAARKSFRFLMISNCAFMCFCVCVCSEVHVCLYFTARVTIAESSN